MAFGPLCSFSAPIFATSLTFNGGIAMSSATSLPSINYIAYSNVVSLHGNASLGWGSFNNLLSVAISTPGTYDFDAQILYAYTVASFADNARSYNIAFSPTAADLDCLYAQYTAGKIDVINSFYSGIQP